MENRSYYRDVAVPDCSQQIDEEPLIVNCAGLCAFQTPFQTWNREGRADYYLQFVTRGKLRIWVGDVLREMEAGDFLLTRPRTPYRYFLPEEEEMEYLWIHFTGFHAGRLLSRLQLETGQIYAAADSIPRIRERFDFLFGEFTNRQRGFDDACASRLTQILVCLSRAASIGNRTAEKKLTTLAWLHGHYTENVPMATLAAMEHLSESRYRSVFRRQTGFSPSEYRGQVIRKGKDGDVLYFTRLFKQKIGVPPGEYRTQSHAEPETSKGETI